MARERHEMNPKNSLNQNNKSVLVALDRDGTLIYDDGYFGKDENWKDSLRLYDGCIEMIKSINEFADVVVITNQIGVARGLYGSERVEEINDYLNTLLKKQGAVVNGWYYCPYVERDWAEKEGLDLNTPWIKDEFPKTRKPEIGMLEQAAKDIGRNLSSYKKIVVIGDSLDDLRLALNAKGIGIWFQNGKNEQLTERVEQLKKINPEKIFEVKNLRKILEIIKSINSTNP